MRGAPSEDDKASERAMIRRENQKHQASLAYTQFRTSWTSKISKLGSAKWGRAMGLWALVRASILERTQRGLSSMINSLHSELGEGPK